MNESGKSRSEDANRDSTAVPIFALWFGAVAGAVALVATDVQLTGRGLYSRPNALGVCIGIELAVAAALFPSLFATVARACMAFAMGFVGLAFCGRLSGAVVTETLLRSVQLLLWCVAFGVMARRTSRVMSLLVVTWCIALLPLWYLVREYGAAPLLSEGLAEASPILSDHPTAVAFIAVVVASVAGFNRAQRGDQGVSG